MADTEPRHGLFRRPSRQVNTFAMIQPQRALARSAALQKVADGPAKRPNQTDTAWQAAAYDYSEQIGELGYVQNLRANAVAGCDLRVMEISPGEDGTDSVDASEDPRAHRVMGALVGPRGGQKELKRRAALHLGCGGETYLIGTPNTEGTQNFGIIWEFLSTEELRVDSTSKVQRRPAGGAWVDLEGECYIGRGWRSDPRFTDRADSEMRRVLNVCAEILYLSRVIEGVAKSRLPQGLLFVPDELSFADEDAADTEDDLDPFLRELFEHLSTPIEDPTSAAALVPLVLRGKAEFGEKVLRIDLHKSMDNWVQEFRQEALHRLARGLDVPPEIVMGKASLNHWTAYNIDNDFIVKHVVPIGELLADFLTYAYLRPMLEEYEGLTADEAARFILEFDPAPITARADEAVAARALHDRKVLSDLALVRSNGFGEEDMPDDDERRLRVAMDLILANPQVFGPALIHMIPGFEDVEIAAPEPAGPGFPGAGPHPEGPTGRRPGGVKPPVEGGVPRPLPADATDKTSGQDAPTEKADTAAAAIQDRLASSADAYLERALEKACAKVVTKASKDPSLRDRLASVGRSEALTLITPSEVEGMGFTATTLLDGAWSSYSTKARAWVREWLDPAGVKDPFMVDEATSLIVNRLVDGLDVYAVAHLHRPIPTYSNGLRVPAELVDDALSLAVAPA